MKTSTLVCVCLILFAGSVGTAAGSDQQKQQELDAACEAARQKALKPIREEKIAECIAEGTDAATCQSDFAYFGERRGNQVPLFYDLPECEAADDYRRSDRAT